MAVCSNRSDFIGDYYSDTISFHAYRSPAVGDTQNPSLSYQQANVARIQDVIRNNNPDGQIEDLYVTKTNAGLSGHNPDDPHVNAQLAQLYLQLIHQAKTYDSSHSWLRGILKFKFDDTNNPVNRSPEYTGVHQYYFTYNLIAQTASKIKDILNVDTTLPGDQLLVSRDPSYYYVLLSNLSSADTQKIDLDTLAIGISNAPAYFTTSNANQVGTRWDKTITNGALTFYIAPDTVTLIKIPRGYTARTISSIDISPSSTVSVGLYGAKEFTATAQLYGWNLPGYFRPDQLDVFQQYQRSDACDRNGLRQD